MKISIFYLLSKPQYIFHKRISSLIDDNVFSPFPKTYWRNCLIGHSVSLVVEATASIGQLVVYPTMKKEVNEWM